MLNLNLRALAMFLRDICRPCRPADDLMAVADATAESELRFEDTPLYHAVVSEMAEALAAARASVHGAADWAAWSAEMSREDS